MVSAPKSHSALKFDLVARCSVGASHLQDFSNILIHCLGHESACVNSSSSSWAGTVTHMDASGHPGILERPYTGTVGADRL